MMGEGVGREVQGEGAKVNSKKIKVKNWLKGLIRIRTFKNSLPLYRSLQSEKFDEKIWIKMFLPLTNISISHIISIFLIFKILKFIKHEGGRDKTLEQRAPPPLTFISVNIDSTLPYF